MERSNVEKIIDEMLFGLLDDSEDSEEFDFEENFDDAEERLWKPSHVIFDKPTIKRGHTEVMKDKSFCDISIMRPGGEDVVPHPEKDEVVVF
jgi:hypothetical protein